MRKRLATKLSWPEVKPELSTRLADVSRVENPLPRTARQKAVLKTATARDNAGFPTTVERKPAG